MMKIVGVILAAGASTRLGRPKQLLVIDGETLLARTIRMARASRRLESLVVILGAHRDAIAASLPSEVTAIENPDFAEGIGSSVRKAAEWAMNVNADGLLLMVCDQARLSSEHLSQLLSAFDGTRPVGSRYGGSVGVPAVFPRPLFTDLVKLEGDRGAKSVLASADSVDWPDGLVDIDTEADLHRGFSG
jgi:molybdenum cofactor cytidylyltransferase